MAVVVSPSTAPVPRFRAPNHRARHHRSRPASSPHGPSHGHGRGSRGRRCGRRCGRRRRHRRDGCAVRAAAAARQREQADRQNQTNGNPAVCRTAEHRNGLHSRMRGSKPGTECHAMRHDYVNITGCNANNSLSPFCYRHFSSSEDDIGEPQVACPRSSAAREDSLPDGPTCRRPHHPRTRPTQRRAPRPLEAMRDR